MNQAEEDGRRGRGGVEWTRKGGPRRGGGGKGGEHAGSWFSMLSGVSPVSSAYPGRAATLREGWE